MPNSGAAALQFRDKNKSGSHFVYILAGEALQNQCFLSRFGDSLKEKRRILFGINIKCIEIDFYHACEHNGCVKLAFLCTNFTQVLLWILLLHSKAVDDRDF